MCNRVCGKISLPLSIIVFIFYPTHSLPVGTGMVSGSVVWMLVIIQYLAISCSTRIERISENYCKEMPLVLCTKFDQGYQS